MLTAKRAFLLIAVGFQFIHIPIITATFGFLIVWAVVGWRWAIIIALIGTIPDLAISMVRFVFGWSFSATPILSMISHCDSIFPNKKSTEYSQCLINSLNSPLLNWIINYSSNHDSSISSPTLALFQDANDFLQSIRFIKLILVSGAIGFLGYVMYDGIKRFHALKNNIRQRISGLYGFKQIKRKHDPN